MFTHEDFIYARNILPGNTRILEGVCDRGQGRGEGQMPPPLTCYNLWRGWRDCSEKGANYYMKNGFGSELFFNKLASLK
jgi:hypothetical protein